MQFDPKTCLKTFDQYYKIDFQSEEHQPKTEPIIYHDNPILVIDNVLTTKECQQLIENSQKTGYHSMKREYSDKQRDNTRILCINKELAKTIWQRLKNTKQFKNLAPFGFDCLGKWEAEKINDCFRFSQYTAPSIGFKYHYDASYIEDADHRSVLSLVIYLNDDFTGGETGFYECQRQLEKTVAEEMRAGFNKICTIKPKTGSVVIFRHDTLHAGLSVIKGAKYIIRGDVIYKRTEKIKEGVEYTSVRKLTKSWFSRAIYYYREAGNLEVEGKVEEASEMYERALNIRQWFGGRAY